MYDMYVGNGGGRGSSVLQNILVPFLFLFLFFNVS